MSQQHGLPLPPPPPHPAQSSTVTGGGLGPVLIQRRRQTGPVRPPSITTNFLRTQGIGSQATTPASGLSPGHIALPYNPASPAISFSRTPIDGASDAHRSDFPRAQLQSPASPSMAQQPYNPRQWSGHGPHLAYSQHASPLSRGTMEVTGMEGASPQMFVQSYKRRIGVRQES